MTTSVYRPPRLYIAIGVSLILHLGLLLTFSQFSFKPVSKSPEKITRISLVPSVMQSDISQAITEPVRTVPPEVLPDEMEEVSVEAVPVTPPPVEPLSGEEPMPVETPEPVVIEAPVKPDVRDEAQIVIETVPAEETVPEESFVISAASPEQEAGESVEVQVEGPETVSFDTLIPRGTLAVPAYPSRAKRLGYQGRVVLELTISTEGRVTDVKVVEVETDAPEMLIESCLSTVSRKWRFRSPGQELVTRKTFRFRLNS